MPHSQRTRQKLDAELAVHLRKGRVDRAAATLGTIVEKDRDDDRLFVRLAELRLKLGDEAGARAAYQGAAEAAEKRGFYLRAMAALRQQARTLPAPARPWVELSRLALRLGLVADALGFLDEGVRAWEAAGDRPRVLSGLRRCHELSPDDVRRSLRLAHELCTAGSQPEAVALLRADAERHRREGRDEAWLSLARDLVVLAPTPPLCRDVARTLLGRGEPRGALKVLRSVLEGAEPDREAAALAERAREELGKPVRPPLPETPPVLVATPFPGTLRAVRPGSPAPPRPTPVLARALTPPPARALVPPPPAQPHARRSATPPEGPTPTRPVEPVAAPPPRLADQDDDELVDLGGADVSVEDEALAAAWSAVVERGPEADHELVHLSEAIAEDELTPIPPEGAADELAHATFLVVHGFEDEARELLDALAAAHPDHPGVVDLLVRMATGRERVPPRTQPAAPLASGPTPPGEAAAPPLTEVDFASAEAVLESFRQGVAAAVASDDWATRYDLAIAYREMGLWSDALAEFECALLSAPGARAVDCLVGVAQCHAGRGHHAEAARALERALGVVPLPPAAAAAVSYELGVVRQGRGEAAAAARAFEAADRAVPGFRDARALAERLGRGEAGREAAAPAPVGGLLPDPA